MEIVNLSLPATNRFASAYLEQSDDVMSFFHYRFNNLADDSKRLAELSTRKFPREELAEYIEKFMDRFPTSPAVKTSLNKLKKPESVVVIGGQQAGILTGPLFSIHKIISVIKLAQEKERQLGIPVVPVFWIAGEDHDFQEVNHVFVPVNQKMDKWTYPERVWEKKMVSDIKLNKQVCLSWVKNVIENFGETKHTKTLLDFAGHLIEKSDTFVDFFAQIIMELFKDSGILLVDSGDPNFRLLQQDLFIEQINHHQDITLALLEQQKKIQNSGFPLAIEATEESANLFYYDRKHNERILLEYDSIIEQFVGKNGTVSFTKNELVGMAKANPAQLSNNVVTRPLMQELLFPTLAFIAGPGEIAYWAELKLVFEHFEMKMPQIVPRLNITFLDRSVETDIEELELALVDVLKEGTKGAEERFLESIKDREIDALFQTARELLLEQYRLIEQKTVRVDSGLLPLLNKNEAILLKEINFMQSKLENAVKFKFDITLNKFNRVNLALRPGGSPQERIWNVFYYLNQYGMDFLSNVMRLSFEFDGKHKVIKI